jgi:hypothetical protein
MKTKQLIKINVSIITILTLILAILLIAGDGGNAYFAFGPDVNLHFVSFTIDSWGKYVGVLVGIIPLAWMDVYSYDKIGPYFFERIYMEDSPIKDWTREEKWKLAFWAELSYGTTNFRMILDTLLTVTNFYFAIWRWILKEIICIYIINGNLNRKFKALAADNTNVSLLNETLLYKKNPADGLIKF